LIDQHDYRGLLKKKLLYLYRRSRGVDCTKQGESLREFRMRQRRREFIED